MSRANGNRYTLVGYLVWQGGKWYLRKRLPSPRKVLLTGAGALATCTAAVLVAKRLAG